VACTVCTSPSFTNRASVQGTVYVACNGCGVVYQNPIPSASMVEEIYNHDDSTYFISDAKNSDFLAGEDWLRGSAKFFIEQLQQQYKGSLEGASVLDFGCGTGILLDELQKRGSRCTGVEMSPWACRYGRERFGLTMLNEDVMTVDLPSESFDVIVMSHVIEHLPNPPVIINRLATLLKSGGLLMIGTPYSDSLGARIFGKNWLYYLPNEHLHLFNDRSIRHLLESSNLRVQAIEHYLWRKRSTLGALAKLPLGLLQTTLKGATQFVTAKDGLIAFAQKP
jgi:2-polyprenyl-3-methyl-5-hydroxy-6-metoxy-1,4-benzoquinol methylase